jgi:RNA polymerase primary sigma factor
LYEAGKRFKKESGAKFSTYAGWYMRQRMYKYAQKSKIVSLTTNMTTAASRMNRIIESLREELGHTPTNEEVSEITGVSVDRLETLKGYSYTFLPIDEPAYKDGMNNMTIGDTIEDENASRPDEVAENVIDFHERNTILQEVLKELPARERLIIKRRFGLNGYKPANLETIGQSLKVTRERIRQLQNQALKRIKTQYKKLLNKNKQSLLME